MLKHQRKTSFAKLFPAIIYDPDQTNNPSLDIWSSFVALSDPVGFDSELYLSYQLESGDTLESIADKVYGDVFLWWLVLLANDVEDPFDFLDNINQRVDEDKKIKVFNPSYTNDIFNEIRRNARKNNVNFEGQNRK